MREKLEIALLIGNFHLNKRRKNKIVENNEKIFNSAIQFPTKSLLQPMVFTETTRQRWS